MWKKEIRILFKQQMKFKLQLSRLFCSGNEYKLNLNWIISKSIFEINDIAQKLKKSIGQRKRQILKSSILCKYFISFVIIFLCIYLFHIASSAHCSQIHMFLFDLCFTFHSPVFSVLSLFMFNFKNQQNLTHTQSKKNEMK